jgi:hypothetical protein
VNILIWGVLTHWGGGRGEWWRAFGRLRREDGTASSERHVNKPHSVSKCWRKHRKTFRHDLTSDNSVRPPPQKRDDLLWQKAQTI